MSSVHTDVTAGLRSVTRTEVESQPAVWTRVLNEADVTTAVLPDAGTPVLFVGCGTSFYIGECYARRRNSLGLGRTRAAIASEIPYVDPAETVVVLSRSGRTTDLIRAAERLGAHSDVVGIVGENATPILDVCTRHVLLDYADEKSVVQTRFATSALALLRASLGEDLTQLPDQGRAALAAPLPVSIAGQVVFLGTDWTIGLAHEAALKCREAAGSWTEAYALMEYQHGPISVAGDDTLVWSFAPVPSAVRLAIEATGATLFTMELDPLAQMPLVHRLALALAERAGRNVDHPRFLSRSVQLD